MRVTNRELAEVLISIATMIAISCAILSLAVSFCGLTTAFSLIYEGTVESKAIEFQNPSTVQIEIGERLIGVEKLAEKQDVFAVTQEESGEIEEVTQEVKSETQEISYESEVIACLCKVVYGEARGCDKTQQAAVVWCILNRVEDSRFPNDIISVVTQANQFEGYSSSFPVVEEIEELVCDVLSRYELECNGAEEVGRVLPKDYLFFRSSGTGVNVFRQEYNSKTIWDWSWGTPYGES